MTRHIKKVSLGLAALLALAFGGSALAQAGGQGAPAKPSQQSEAPASAPDTDNVQDGNGAQDENGADDATGKSEKSEQGDTDNVQEENGKDDASEQGESGSETPGDDGPGGHADERAAR